MKAGLADDLRRILDAIQAAGPADLIDLRKLADDLELVLTAAESMSSAQAYRAVHAVAAFAAHRRDAIVDNGANAGGRPIVP